METVRAFAPGRVNLIGDHTDYTGGLVLPMAIDLGTTIEGVRTGDVVALRSTAEEEPAVVALDTIDPSAAAPAWARYVAGVVDQVRPATGLRGTVTTTLPVGGGLSSSAALEVALALALGAPADDPVSVAQLCQRAEQDASGVPCGVMDQLAAAAGVDGHALLIDCHSLTIDPVPLPSDAAIIVVHSGESRALVATQYATRRAECEAAERLIGPLRTAGASDTARISHLTLRRRARHVVTENERVREVAVALRADDLPTAGSLMLESHVSLRDDFDASTPALNDLVTLLANTPGVHGARLTGAGFGGCVVALADADAEIGGGGRGMWRVRASAGAWLEVREATA